MCVELSERRNVAVVDGKVSGTHSFGRGFFELTLMPLKHRRVTDTNSMNQQSDFVFRMTYFHLREGTKQKYKKVCDVLRGCEGRNSASKTEKCICTQSDIEL